MSKLREDYQFVYDTLSLRASMLVSPLGGGGSGGVGVGGGGSKSESTTSSSRDSAVSGDKTALGDKTVPVTTTDISTGTGTGDSVKVDVVGVSVGVTVGADTVITSASSSEKVQSTYSTNSTSDPLTSSVAPSRSNVVVEDEDGNVMALLQSLESRRKFQVR